MKKILGTALAVGFLAYGLNTNVFANESKVDNYQNNSYSIEKLDDSSNVDRDENYNNRYNNRGGYCGSQNGNYRGCQGNDYNQGNIESESMSYSNF